MMLPQPGAGSPAEDFKFAKLACTHTSGYVANTRYTLKCRECGDTKQTADAPAPRWPYYGDSPYQSVWR